jgi:1,4-alpha-glucan branching enzyme
LHYISKDPAYRRYHHNDITFSMVYAFDENFVLPISHDEVVYGKGSLLGKMPGDEWQQAANLRTYAGFMYAHPGKKLNFMGNEFAQFEEWDHDGELDWGLLQHSKHQQVQHLYKTLNTLYQQYPALHACDHEHHGFAWLTHDDAERSILSFLRHDPQTKQTIYVLCNFTPVPVEHVRIGLEKGTYSVLLNTDDIEFGGSGYVQDRQLVAQNMHSHGKDYSIELTLPPLSTMFWIKQD